MEEEFWQYSKNIYAKSSKSFLWLQDERSLDVNLLLFCYWLGEKGKRLTVDDISRCCKTVEFLRRDFIIPLRNSRLFLKNADLPIDYKKLKQAILTDELEGERTEQRILISSLSKASVECQVTDHEDITIMHHNILNYLRYEKVDLDGAVKSTLNEIALSLFPYLSREVLYKSFLQHSAD